MGFIDKMWAVFSAKNTIKAMCETYFSSLVRNPEQLETERLIEAIDARYIAYPLNSFQRSLYDQGIFDVYTLHEACLFVILLEAEIQQGKYEKLEHKLEKIIKKAIEKHTLNQARKSKQNSFDIYPKLFTDELQRRLGDQFTALEDIALRYSLFKQPFMSKVLHFTEELDLDEVEFKIMMFSSFLTSLGNKLATQGIQEDAEAIFQMGISMKPNDYSIRGSLALLYYATGRCELAKQEAEKALNDRDEMLRTNTIDIPEDVAPAEALEGFRNSLMAIIEGTL